MAPVAAITGIKMFVNRKGDCVSSSVNTVDESQEWECGDEVVKDGDP